MAEVQTKALFTCTEAGYDAALSIMELYRKNGMQAFFYGIAEEAEMGGFTVDISINDLLLPK